MSVISSVHLESGFGALFRCFRLALFVGTLWLLSRWWDGGQTFVRHHIRMYFAVLATVAAGLVVSPGAALPDLYGGRLVGALWPLTPPQIGQYAAVIIGLTVLLLLGRRTDRTSAAVVIVPSLVLLASDPYPDGHARPARRAGAGDRSLILTSAAARRFFTWAVLCATVAAVGFASALQAWFLRGQSQENFVQPHRPGQGLATRCWQRPGRPRRSVRRGSGRQVVRRAAHRQQLAGRLQRAGPDRRHPGRGDHHRAGRRRAAAATVAVEGLRDLPDQLLRDRLVHRGRPRRRLAVSAAPGRGRLAARGACRAHSPPDARVPRRRVPRLGPEIGGDLSMHVLVVHNRYASAQPSGENKVVDQEVALLREAGHRVEVFERRSDDIAARSLPGKVAVPLLVPWNPAVRTELAARLRADRPDVVHVHNVFPLLSPAVLAACADAGVPAVATLHNYTQVCPPGTLQRDGRPCTECVGSAPLPAVRHGCYRSSRLATVPLAVSLSVNRRRWWSGVERFFCISAAQRDVLVRPACRPSGWR